MADNSYPAVSLRLCRDRIAESFDAKFEFKDRPPPVPADIRADWRVPLLMLIVKSCRGGRASLQQVQSIAWAAIFEESREEFLEAFSGNGGTDPAVLLIRYDPAVTRAVNLAVGLGLLLWATKGRLVLTDKGKCLLDEIQRHEGVLADERAFLSQLGGVTMKRINAMLEQ